jgi:hypothetical protein
MHCRTPGSLIINRKNLTWGWRILFAIVGFPWLVLFWLFLAFIVYRVL